jgi:hypothetical protein
MNPGGAELDIYLSPLNMLDAKQALTMPAPGAGQEEDDAAGAAGDGGLDEGQRTVLARYVVRYGKPFVDAFRRAGSDPARLRSELQPVVASIADGAIHRDPFGPRDDEAANRIAGEVGEGVMRRMKKAGPAWIFSESLCRDEFRRVVRAIHIRSARESAAIVATRQLEAEKEEESDAD